MDEEKLLTYVNCFWDKSIIPILQEYIKIPNKSPSFDPLWEEHGYMLKALNLAVSWIKNNINNRFSLEIKSIKGRTPLIFIKYNGELSENILMYGHLDKQPEMVGWDDDLGPWNPVIKNNKLYGRGGADDGYALFASICSINALIEQNIKLPNISIIIEFSEESGSPDLPYYLNLLNKDLPKPDLIICLDSGTGNYEQFWMTTSLRGMIGATIRIDVLEEGVHSGGASGLVPSSFRILRQILSRIEDELTGEILIDDIYPEIPSYRKQDIKECIKVLGKEIFTFFPWSDKISPTTFDPEKAVMKLTWEPALSLVGIDGVPKVTDAGNVLRPYTEVKFSLRIPPLVDTKKIKEKLKNIILSDTPYNSKIILEFEETADGWNAPELSTELKNIVNKASIALYDKPAICMGEGGTIPFMAMLGKKYPKAQFIITGVLGPGSNAHGPNEFLNIPYVKKLNCCISYIIKNFRKLE